MLDMNNLTITATSKQCARVFFSLVSSVDAVAAKNNPELLNNCGTALLATLNEGAGVPRLATPDAVTEAGTVVLVCAMWNLRAVDMHNMEFPEDTVFNALGPVEFLKEIGISGDNIEAKLDALEAQQKEDNTKLN